MDVVWYPAADTNQVVGYFDYEEKLDSAATREAGEYQYRKVVVLREKALGSGDISVRELKPHAKSRLVARFPTAWEAFENGEVPVRENGYIMPAGIKGTPLTRLELSGEQLRLYNAGGIYTVEQMADAGEAVKHRLGFGADKIIKRAQEYLDGKPKRGRPKKVVEDA